MSQTWFLISHPTYFSLLHTHTCVYRRSRSPMSSMPTPCPSSTKYSDPNCPAGPSTLSPSISRSGTVISLPGRRLFNRSYRRKRYAWSTPWIFVLKAKHASRGGGGGGGGEEWSRTKWIEGYVILTDTAYIICWHPAEARIQSTASARIYDGPFTTTKVCSATHQSQAIQPADRDARSSAQHKVASKGVCHLSDCR